MSDANKIQGSEKFLAFVKTFAVAIGKDEAATAAGLTQLVDADDAGVATLQDESATTLDDYKGAFSDVKLPKLRAAVNGHRAKVEDKPTAAAGGSAAAQTFDVLPTVLDDTSWLTALKTSGELKVDEATVLSAVRAAIANRCGLFQLPDILVDQMEAHANSIDEPLGKDYFAVQKSITTREYGDLFAALDIGGAGRYVTATRRKEFLTKLDQTLWPALLGFHSQLKGWSESWQQGSANPAMMMQAFLSLVGGMNGAGALPPGMMQPPSINPLRDAAEGVIQKINKLFGGFGVLVARALAYDAQNIKGVLDNPLLPGQVGALNREQMLKGLNVGVSNDYPRLEQDLTKYTLAVMHLPKVTGEKEIAYVTGMIVLGNQIAWDKVQVARPVTSSSRRSPSAFPEDR